MQIVEAGAHGGELAMDILTWLRENRPDLWAKLEYWILEPSETRRHWQQEKLDDFKRKVQWVTNWAALPDASAQYHGRPPHLGPLPLGWGEGESSPAQEQTGSPPLPTSSPRPSDRPRPSDGRGIKGEGPWEWGERRGEGAFRIIFSNELLDSFPAHRLGWDATKRVWFEWGVDLQNSKFTWTRMSDDYRVSSVEGGGLGTVAQLLDASTLQRFDESTPLELRTVLPDGYTTEICPAATEWWQQAANALPCGKLLTIDYGSSAEELFAPHRKEGTLRAYRKHQPANDLLADPGEQDLTAHVNFSAVQQAGETAGLITEAFTTQEQLLASIASRIWNKMKPLNAWTASQKRQFQTLTHPDHLGRSFRVLIQSKPR